MLKAEVLTPEQRAEQIVTGFFPSAVHPKVADTIKWAIEAHIRDAVRAASLAPPAGETWDAESFVSDLVKRGRISSVLWRAQNGDYRSLPADFLIVAGEAYSKGAARASREAHHDA